jgi:hypothetical protein
LEEIDEVDLNSRPYAGFDSVEMLTFANSLMNSGNCRSGDTKTMLLKTELLHKQDTELAKTKPSQFSIEKSFVMEKLQQQQQKHCKASICRNADRADSKLGIRIVEKLGVVRI